MVAPLRKSAGKWRAIQRTAGTTPDNLSTLEGRMEMKQGPSKDISAPKREPIPKSVNPGGVDQLGSKVAVRSAYEPVYEGRGYKAPMAGKSVHPSGSQGKHR